MKYKIIVDSCGELTPEMKQDERFASAALTLEVGADTIVDDDSFDQADFLAKVAASKESVKSACPAPESYMEAYSKADDIYVVTLSAELSGSYNSAVLGKNLYEEENGTKNIHVVNSRGAATHVSSTNMQVRECHLKKWLIRLKSIQQVLEHILFWRH